MTTYEIQRRKGEHFPYTLIVNGYVHNIYSTAWGAKRGIVKHKRKMQKPQHERKTVYREEV